MNLVPNLNLDTQLELLKYATCKTVIVCTSVSNDLKRSIKSPAFVADHTALRENRQHYLLLFNGFLNEIIVLDDGNLEGHRYHHTIPPGLSVATHHIEGISHGIFGLKHGYEPNFILWNPAIRKTMYVPVGLNDYDVLPYTFGVCPRTLEPKVIKILAKRRVAWVYTLGFDAWRRERIDLPVIREDFSWFGSTVTDSFIYWKGHHVIVALNVTSLQFEVIDFPRNLGRIHQTKVMQGQLGVVTSNGTRSDVYLFNMDDRTFTRILTIDTAALDALRPVLGFTQNGTPIVMVPNDDDDERVLRSAVAMYDRDSEEFTRFGGVLGHWSNLHMHESVETLLLLNHVSATGY